jgi:hypothetical protein
MHDENEAVRDELLICRIAPGSGSYDDRHFASGGLSQAVDGEGGVGDDVEGALADEVGVGFDGAGGAVVEEGGAADRLRGRADVFARADDFEDAAAGGMVNRMVTSYSEVIYMPD